MATLNKAFAKKNKNTVEERRRIERRSQAIDALLAGRKRMPPANVAMIRAAREKGRP